MPWHSPRSSWWSSRSEPPDAKVTTASDGLRGILATSWRPEADYLELMRAVVEIFHKPEEPGADLWQHVSRLSAPSYFEGSYRPLVRKGDPAKTLESFGRLWKLRHDTGTATVSLLGPTEGSIELAEYGLVSPEACRLIEGTIWGLVKYAGAEEIEIEHPRCRAQGAPVCEWRVRWTLDT